MHDLPSGTVTFLFTDLGSSTRLWEQHPADMQTALARHDALLTEAVHAHGGQIVKTTGDGLHAVFATADAALAAALDGQHALERESWGPTGALRVRMGLHTGVAEERAGDYYGPSLNRAARLMGLAHPGQVLCSRTTADLVRDALPDAVTLVDLGPHELRDLARPEIVFQVTHADLDAEFPALPTSATAIGNLPRQVTSFVGRDAEVVRVVDELGTNPVVTLTGVGGVGKTRLALEAATVACSKFRDGAWFAELAGVREADALPDAVLEVFAIQRRRDLTATQMLVEFLRAKELLLVLDNCEHLLRPAARLVNEIVRACPDVRIAATSREGLDVAGERILVVASLDVPEAADHSSLEAVAGSEAVRLFVERARSVRSGFALDATNAIAVAQVCRRLDGVPLAIELAAARVAMLTPAELARRLDHRFRVLTGSDRGVVERHQTLRAAIDWSYDLLDERERRLLERLSVFAGGFTLMAGEAVGEGPPLEEADVFEVLAALVARSLVVADPGAADTRYRLLETIRQYAQERLDETGDTDRVRNAHAHYFAGFAAEVAIGLDSPDEHEWLERLVADLDNLRVALAWAAEAGDVDSVLAMFQLGESPTALATEIGQLLGTAAVPALSVPRIGEDPRYPIVLAWAAQHAVCIPDLDRAERYCDDAEAAEARLGIAPGPTVCGARIWVTLTAARTGDYLQYSEQLNEICRTRGENTRLAVALTQCAMARALGNGDMVLAVSEIDEALRLANRLAVPSVIAQTLAFSSFVLADVQPDRARALMFEAARLHEVEDLRGPVHAILGDVAERLGDRRLALEYFTKGMEELHWLGNSEHVGRMLQRVGLLVIDDDPESAAMITGAAATRSIGFTMTNRVVSAWESGMQRLDELLGAPRRAELQSRGATMDDHEAMALARAAVERSLG